MSNVLRAAIAAYPTKQAIAPAEIEQRARSVSAPRLVCKGPCDFVPMICAGSAVSCVNLPDGSRQILSFTLPGELVDAALIFEPVQNCIIEAITDVQYRTFNRNELTQFLSNHPGAFESIARVWVEEKTRADHLIVDLGRRSAEKRIARLIVHLVKRIKARGMAASDLEQVAFPLRHHHIADATGLTLMHVSKVLSDLRRRKILALGGRSLSILDPIALYRVAGEQKP
jgi:CRP/FNR family transcriptional regulator